MEPLLFFCLCVGFIMRTDCQNLPQKHQIENYQFTFYTPVDTGNFNKYPVYIPNWSQRSTPVQSRRPANRPNEDQRPVNTAEQLEYDPNVLIETRSSTQKPQIQFDATSAALTNFTLHIMRKVVIQKRGNTVVSPYSVASLLALLQQGAKDDALDQINGVLQMKPQESAAAYKSQTEDIKGRNTRNILRSANNIFLADTFSLNPLFKSVAKRDFDSDVTPTSFDKTTEAAELINNWVATKTENKINNLVTPESIGSNSQIVLVNAIYFKGLWEAPFRTTSTKQDTFFLSDGTQKTVPFMQTRQKFKAGVDGETDSRVIVMPFENEEYAMMVILPSTLSNAHDAYGLLTVPLLERYLNLKTIEVALKIPKFAIRADTNLTPVLKEMGITKIFEQNSGLSNLGLHSTYTPQVSSSVHSAVLSIDEEGGSAAGATYVAVVALSNDSPSMSLKMNRPFVAILWDMKTRVPLFSAVIEDPSL